MLDIAFIVLTIAFFVLSIGYVVLCDRLMNRVKPERL